MLGRLDYICPAALSERLHEESGHMPWLEEPNPFFAALDRFLVS
jgi:hypothetical protein